MRKKKILLIDNYDSFTQNLSHLLTDAGGKVTIVRNDANFLPGLEAGKYDSVVIGPGPGSPDDLHYFGKNHEVITRFGTSGLPVFGVCLGFQGIAHAFGARLKRATVPVHGKTSELDIVYRDEIMHSNIPQNVEVMRYHSLMIDPDSMSASPLIPTSEVKRDAESVAINGPEIMSLRHSEHPIYGVQFHPESFVSELGLVMVRNFLEVSGKA